MQLEWNRYLSGASSNNDDSYNERREGWSCVRSTKDDLIREFFEDVWTIFMLKEGNVIMRIGA